MGKNPREMSTRDPIRILALVLLAVLALGAAAGTLWLLRAVFVPLMLAFILAYCLAPAVARLERRRVPRAASAAGLLCLVLGAAVLFLVLFIPALQEELDRFARQLPGMIRGLRARAEPLAASWGVAIPSSIDGAVEQLGDDLRSLVPGLAKPLTAALRSVFSSTVHFVVGLTGALMVPLFSFYFLRDWERILAGARGLLPRRWDGPVAARFVRFDEVLGGYLRGQVYVGLVLGVYYAVCLSALGIRLGWMIGLAAGLLNLVPYLGVLTGLALSVLMAVLGMAGWGTLAGVGAVFAVAQVLESFVLTPKIVGDKTGLGDVQVIVALLVGGELFGFLGVLLAVPSAAVLNVMLGEAVGAWRRSRHFADPAG